MRTQNNRFQQKRHVVLFIYDYTCQMCGIISFSNHCHHINGNGNNHDAFNLIPLCVDCHILVHKLHIGLLPGPNPQQVILLEKLNRQ